MNTGHGDLFAGKLYIWYDLGCRGCYVILLAVLDAIRTWFNMRVLIARVNSQIVDQQTDEPHEYVHVTDDLDAMYAGRKSAVKAPPGGGLSAHVTHQTPYGRLGVGPDPQPEGALRAHDVEQFHALTSRVDERREKRRRHQPIGRLRQWAQHVTAACQ